MTLAKGLGGGVPVGAVLAKDHAAVFVPGDHGSTFGGNVLTCAVAHATVTYILNHGILTHAQQMGAYPQSGLKTLHTAHAGIVEVRGMDLLWAIEFSTDIAATVVAACNEAGLLLNPVRPHAIRLMPPLTVSKTEIDQALEKLSAVLELGLRAED